MSKFRKKPVVIEAVQFDGENYQEVLEWTGSKWCSDCGLKEPAGAYGNHINGKFVAIALWIQTLDGRMNAHVGDWIIKGVKGEFYPCKPDVFAETYEPVGEREP